MDGLKINNMKELFKLTIEFTRIFIGFILAITILVTFDIYYELKRLYERSREFTTSENDIPRQQTRNNI
jgi:cell division protein FtsL